MLVRILNKVKFTVRRLLALLPTTLPQGMTEFTAWSESIIELYGMPNNDSVKFALATMVLHLKHTEDRKPKAYFGACLRKAAANQIVSAFIQEAKNNQQTAINNQPK